MSTFLLLKSHVFFSLPRTPIFFGRFFFSPFYFFANLLNLTTARTSIRMGSLYTKNNRYEFKKKTGRKKQYKGEKKKMFTTSRVKWNQKFFTPVFLAWYLLLFWYFLFCLKEEEVTMKVNNPDSEKILHLYEGFHFNPYHHGELGSHVFFYSASGIFFPWTTRDEFSCKMCRIFMCH